MFTLEELIKLKNGIEYLPQMVNLDSKYIEECAFIMIKLNTLIQEILDKADYESQRGISVPVDTNPSRE